MVHGRKPRLAEDPERPAILTETNDLMDKYDARLRKFDHLHQAQQQAVERQVAAAHRVEDQYRQLGDRQWFNTNEWVMIRSMENTKLAPECYGPARVVRQMLFYAYKLALLNGDEIPELFHNERLQRCKIGELVPQREWAKVSVKLKQRIDEQENKEHKPGDTN
ncbi:hypothetical protein LPJ77_002549 [Coemansia sp. RSA 2523]|nr:hypothetical protein LPJ77_002549 [Coemansia sp. RSA 2523]